MTLLKEQSGEGINIIPSPFFAGWLLPFCATKFVAPKHSISVNQSWSTDRIAVPPTAKSVPAETHALSRRSREASRLPEMPRPSIAHPSHASGASKGAPTSLPFVAAPSLASLAARQCWAHKECRRNGCDGTWPQRTLTVNRHVRSFSRICPPGRQTIIDRFRHLSADRVNDFETPPDQVCCDS